MKSCFLKILHYISRMRIKHSQLHELQFCNYKKNNQKFFLKEIEF